MVTIIGTPALASENQVAANAAEGFGWTYIDGKDLVFGKRVDTPRASIAVASVMEAVAKVAREAKRIGLSLTDEDGNEREIRLYVVGRVG